MVISVMISLALVVVFALPVPMGMRPLYVAGVKVISKFGTNGGTNIRLD